MFLQIHSQTDSPQQSQATAQLGYIPEDANQFLALFPHRYDFIWSPHVAPGEPASWQTESRHPLSDRVIQQGSSLYGVRFGAQTRYVMLDIDRGSPYHPAQDPFAISRMVQALESLGLVQYIVCTSSYSGGLHLYFPFETPQSSWQIAIIIATVLENAGFKLVPGHLEAFPNPKPYLANSTPTLFQAHRLPLQAGSYLLNAHFEPIWSTPERFVESWQLAAQCNVLEATKLKQILKQVRRHPFSISGKADKFLNDLNAEIELGWTGSGQTNRLLGRITMRLYIFHHVLTGSEPLSGQKLIDRIVQVARSLPGYQEWCNHQHEIEHRAEEWARCIENSHYFHYGDHHGKFKAKLDQTELDQALEQAPTWNQQQLESARDRIRNAIADLLEKEELPTHATARFKALLQYGVGGGSLYKHRDLWHPEFLLIDLDSESIEPMKSIEQSSRKDSLSQELTEIELIDQSKPQGLTSLLPGNGSNVSLDNASSDFDLANSEMLGSNSAISDSDFREIYLAAIEDLRETHPLETEINSESIVNSRLTDRCHPVDPAQVEKMQRFLNSGDPILQAEAYAWARQHPGHLTRPIP
jgi:hypothetical protein